MEDEIPNEAAAFPETRTYWVFHAAFRTDNLLEKVLDDVKLFLDEHKREVCALILLRHHASSALHIKLTIKGSEPTFAFIAKIVFVTSLLYVDLTFEKFLPDRVH